MKVRLLVLVAALAGAVIVAAAPAAAAGTNGTASQQGLGALLAPAPTGLADDTPDVSYGSSPYGYAPATSWGYPGLSTPMTGWGSTGLSTPTTGFGYSGWFGAPWWAGMPLPLITAASGGTWPWAPFYWTPQWWTYAAFVH